MYIRQWILIFLEITTYLKKGGGISPPSFPGGAGGGLFCRRASPPSDIALTERAGNVIIAD